MKIKILLSIIISAFPLLSFSEVVGSWATGKEESKKYFYAGTVNDSGSMLGQFCFSQTGDCLWMLTMKVACKENDKYLVLANSDKGASHLSAHCGKKADNDTYRYVFVEFETVDGMVRDGHNIGFALPMNGDNFRVVRFNLAGASGAIELMHQESARAETKHGSKNTKDLDI